MDVADHTLLTRWQAGDQDAGAALFEAHYEALARFFRNKVDDALRDDLIQQTFLAALTAPFGGRAQVRTWLFSIAWRRLQDHFRKQVRRPEESMESMSVADMGQSPETSLRLRQEQRLLLEGLRRIPLHQQVVLELFYWDDLPVPEIAEALEIPLGTAKTRLRDGRLALARVLEQISASADVLRSTLDDLDGWARRTRAVALPA